MEQKAKLTFEVDPETSAYNPEQTEERILKVRLDKWLWAARFFKTRALARAAIESGKISYEGQKVIPSKEIEIGATLVINQSRGRKVIIIRGLSTRRRSTDEASSLFEEALGQPQDNAEAINVGYAPMLAVEPERRARKIVRFLRRSMELVEPSSTYTEYESKDMIK